MSRPTAAFSATLEVELAHEPGTLGRLCTAIGDVGGNIRSLRGFTVTGGSLREEVVVDAASEAHVEEICEAVDGWCAGRVWRHGYAGEYRARSRGGPWQRHADRRCG